METRFVAYSKYDGQPLPARNPQELRTLLEQGHSAQPPEVNGEAPAGSEGAAPETDQDSEWVRDGERAEDVAADGIGAPVPPAARKRN